ncbi:MAG: ribonuclease E/G, partial [Candidatus Eremiobacteraeota bacterium]|nr:ribonuclease E/G [Candidatus Eremiobacteraeota bacterium]
MVRDSHLEQRLHSGPALDEADEEEIDPGEVETDEEEEPSFKSEEIVEGAVETATVQPARPRRDGERRGGRRGDRRGERRGHGGPRRHSVQTMDLPIISDLLKQGQEILVQIAKEPIAKKGARITSHIALPGRFLVFMPTVNHVGVSRKISSDDERQRLKRILISEKGDASGGFIVRTAADGASEDELRADLRFLISLWNDIRQRA